MAESLPAIAAIGGLALNAVGMAGGAIGGAQEGAQNRADAEYAGQTLRDQNARLLKGGAPPPAYSQSVGGYGQPGADGQYAYMAPPEASFNNDGALQ